MDSATGVQRRELDVILKFLWRNLELKKNDPQITLHEIDGRRAFDLFEGDGRQSSGLCAYLATKGLLNGMVYTYGFTLPDPPIPSEVGRVMEQAYDEFRRNLDQVINAAVSDADHDPSRT